MTGNQLASGEVDPEFLEWEGANPKEIREQVVIYSLKLSFLLVL